MDIENLEFNLLKSSEIKEGDIILVKIDEKEKNNLKKEDIEALYKKILTIINKKSVGIYFFPKNLSLDIIKNHVKITEESKNNSNENLNNLNSNS